MSLNQLVQNDFYYKWVGDRVQASYSADVTLDSTKEYINIDTSLNPVQVELPNSTGDDVQNGKKIYIITDSNTATNNVTVIPNDLDGTTLYNGLSEFIIRINNAIVILELVDNQWVIYQFEPTPSFYFDSVTANNSISRTSGGFTDALQKNFTVPQDGFYKIGYNYQWRHEKKDLQHRVRVRINGSEQTNLRARQYMGGQDDTSSIRMVSSLWDVIDLTAGTYDLDFQWSSQGGETAYLYYRRLYLQLLNGVQ